MLDMFQTMFSYHFMVRAFIVGMLVSLCAALLGVSLVLKRYSMIGDGLSHVGFGSLAVATAMGLSPMIVTIPVVVVAAFLLLRLSTRGKLKGDSAIAMISTGALAIGVIVLSLSTGMTSDVNMDAASFSVNFSWQHSAGDAPVSMDGQAQKSVQSES